MQNSTLVRSLRYLRRRVERYSGRLPLPSLSPDLKLFAGFAAEANDEFRANYRGRSAEIFFANNGRIIHKWLHYFAVYDQILAPYIGSKVKMLEIGVFKGGSLGLWRKFLGEEAVIFGVDIDPNCAAFDGEFASVRIGSQDNPEFLRSVVAEMGGSMLCSTMVRTLLVISASASTCCFHFFPRAGCTSSRTCTPPIGQTLRAA
jgi:hypothetical protein